MSTTPFGHYPSPITSDIVAGAASPLSEVSTNSDAVYWLTRRPSEGGRQVVMTHNHSTDNSHCLTPEGYSVSSRVHEYGGGSYAICKQSLFFVNATDQCIYQQAVAGNSPPRRLTEPTEPAQRIRFGELCASQSGDFLLAVREQHTNAGVINDIVRLDIVTKKIDVIASGEDFYAAIALHSDEKKACFVSWSLPHMPWEVTKLWEIDLLSITTSHLRKEKNEAIYQPGYDTQGNLFCISDDSGFWNLYAPADAETPALDIKQDCGYPMWVMGTKQVVWQDAKTAWVIAGSPGKQTLINSHTGDALALPFTDFQPYLAINCDRECLYFIAGRYDTPDALYEYNIKTQCLRSLAKSSNNSIKNSYFSQPVELTTENPTVFGLYYPPTNPDVTIPNTAPPLIINAHGGPNGAATTSCQLKIQFWTSRGFAYLDVNYRGSTGYGRDYREALNGLWGIADVDDCIHLTEQCVRKNLANSQALFIRGQSAGGLTALAGCVFHDFFTAGTSCYGVADLTTLISDTHKFESGYLDSLIGPYPESESVYTERSPANHIDRLSVPLLFLQGLEDRVVPVEQTKSITDQLDKTGKPYRYVEFANEGHGFRRAENIQAALQAELEFYHSCFSCN